jgi:hypothetical protein
MFPIVVDFLYLFLVYVFLLFVLFFIYLFILHPHPLLVVSNEGSRLLVLCKMEVQVLHALHDVPLRDRIRQLAVRAGVAVQCQHRRVVLLPIQTLLQCLGRKTLFKLSPNSNL